MLTPFLMVPTAAQAAGLHRYPASSRLFTVLLTLAGLPRWRDQNSIAPSNADLALRTGLRPKDKLGLHLARLVELELITIVHRWGRRREIYIHGRHVVPTIGEGPSPTVGGGVLSEIGSTSQSDAPPIRIDPEEIQNPPSPREVVPQTRAMAPSDAGGFGCAFPEPEPKTPTPQEDPVAEKAQDRCDEMAATAEAKRRDLRLGEIIRPLERDWARAAWLPRGGEWTGRHTLLLALAVRDAAVNRASLFACSTERILTELRRAGDEALASLSGPVISPRLFAAHFAMVFQGLDEELERKRGEAAKTKAITVAVDEAEKDWNNLEWRAARKAKMNQISRHLAGKCDGPGKCIGCDTPVVVPRA